MGVGFYKNCVFFGTVGTDCTGWTYTVSGASKDKYYVVYPTRLTDTGCWGYEADETGALDNAIGSGKTNTATVLAQPDSFPKTTIWNIITDMRTNEVNGCDDWYIGSEAEYDALRTSGVDEAVWFGSSYYWSSVERDNFFAFYWNYFSSKWHFNMKGDGAASWGLIPLRSF